MAQQKPSIGDYVIASLAGSWSRENRQGVYVEIYTGTLYPSIDTIVLLGLGNVEFICEKEGASVLPDTSLPPEPSLL